MRMGVLPASVSAHLWSQKTSGPGTGVTDSCKLRIKLRASGGEDGAQKQGPPPPLEKQSK